MSTACVLSGLSSCVQWETHGACLQRLTELEPCHFSERSWTQDNILKQLILSSVLWGICFFLILCIFCFKKLNIPSGEKFFRRSLYVETGKTCVIHRKDELEKTKPLGNREPRPSYLPVRLLWTQSKQLAVGQQPRQPAALRHFGLVTTKRKYRITGKRLRTTVKRNHECKYALLSFTRHKGTEQNWQTLGWLSGSRLYAELSRFSWLLNVVTYCCALLLASKWTSLAPFRFIYYAVRCYLKKILWEKWLIDLHRPALVLTGFICLCQCKLTKGCSRERADLQVGCLLTTSLCVTNEIRILPKAKLLATKFGA